MDQNHS